MHVWPLRLTLQTVDQGAVDEMGRQICLESTARGPMPGRRRAPARDIQEQLLICRVKSGYRQRTQLVHRKFALILGGERTTYP